MNKLYCLWHKGLLVGDILRVEVAVVRSRWEQNEGVFIQGRLKDTHPLPSPHPHPRPGPSPSGTLEQESTSAGLRLDSHEALSVPQSNR